jgi:hypothetical protein
MTANATSTNTWVNSVITANATSANAYTDASNSSLKLYTDANITANAASANSVINTRITANAASTNTHVYSLMTANATSTNTWVNSVITANGISCNAYTDASNTSMKYYVDANVKIANTTAQAAFDKANSGPTITDDTTTATTHYPLLTIRTSGSITASNTSSSKLTYVPSTGTLSATAFSGSGSGLSALGTSTSYQVGSFGVGTAASGTAGEIRATNNITAYYSDDRLKTKLGNIENALNKLMDLNGFYYEANETAQELGYKVKREVGLSAQEVQKVLPEIVSPAPIDDKYLTIHYEKVIPLLVEAIKELKQEIDMLKGSK